MIDAKKLKEQYQYILINYNLGTQIRATLRYIAVKGNNQPTNVSIEYECSESYVESDSPNILESHWIETICTKNINQDHLESDNCSEKYDAKCLKLTKDQCTILKTSELPWHCHKVQCM